MSLDQSPAPLRSARVARLAARVSGSPGAAWQVSVTPAPPPPGATEIALFKARLGALAGLDLDAYKPRQLGRRIAMLAAKAGAPTLDHLYDRLSRDPAQLTAFVAGLTTHVSEFFRTPAAFARLHAETLPALLAAHDGLVIWSAGCSMGAELYGVGILLSELGALDRVTLIGTDVDAEMVARAQDGLYHAHEIANLLVGDEAAFPEPGWLCRYFSPEGRRFRFADEAIRARCRFGVADMLADAPPAAPCHLILCRNVMIAMSEAVRPGLVRRMGHALVPGGTLLVGGAERLWHPDALGFTPAAPGFYVKGS